VQEEFDAGLGCIAADPDQLRQVVMNLVLNALDAMPEGGELHVGTQRVVLEGAGWIQVRVQDNGTGIPESLLETLFDPFVSGREDGAGLGLAISYQIVRQHSGWIDAVNNPDGGATVVVSIPDQQGQEDAQGARGGRPGERPLLVPKSAA
jgi:signal transduction histidine kinase